MKISLPKLAALVLLLGCPSVHAQTLNWGSKIESEIVDSSGQEIDADGSGLQNAFLFQLGAFEEGFIPDETNMGQWLANWHVFDSAPYYNNGDGTSQFSSSMDVHDYRNPSDPQLNDYPSMFEGLKGYIWIYNEAGTEFFLASASSWVFPTLETDCCSNGEPDPWSISDVVVPVWGTYEKSESEPDYIQTQAVPEPGSALLALIACGMTVFRRRRPVLG
ncbi:MAG: PEP-CTERM sorting domain-containing protein [Verrucomicrobiaceae bacterium]|nr:MAG: PEP-CTERM sorting domain-containing protein [Verrucomicrobiaceae bacterium]